MQEQKPSQNPITKQAHRKETFRQITLPLLFGVLAILGLAVWVVLVASGGGNVSHAADASLIFLIIPTFVMAFMLLAVLVGMVYGMYRFLRFLPPTFFVLQGFFYRIQDSVQKAADKAVEPAFRMKSAGAGWQTIKNELTLRKTKIDIPDEGSQEL
ncbi:MAG: hypothetical protein ISR58_15995 [Anaerolineales bacterium]|nr:hypothetical protein [Chloroflexota bacterium]MBL6982676.1 hypothetical protein [Anaerolineales bacterium]